MSTAKLQRAGDAAFGRMEKVNSELLAMTYGAMVTTLIKDFQDIKTVNEEIEKMGYNIGVRLVDEYLAKTQTTQCKSLRDMANAIAKVGFKMFLGINADATKWSSDGNQFSVEFKGNPLIEFVELPEKFSNLDYSNILCGVLRGALNMVQMVVTCRLVRSELKGDPVSEIQVTLNSGRPTAKGRRSRT